MNSSKWFWCKIMFENEHFLLVNTPCSHLHSFYATGVSSGLAGDLDSDVTGGWESPLYRGGSASDFIFFILAHDGCG
jgi:hypothetical protein